MAVLLLSVASDVYMSQKVPTTADNLVADFFPLPYSFNCIQKFLSDWLADGRSHKAVTQSCLIFSWYIAEFSFKNVKSCLMDCIWNYELCFYLANLLMLSFMHCFFLLLCLLPFKHVFLHIWDLDLVAGWASQIPLQREVALLQHCLWLCSSTVFSVLVLQRSLCEHCSLAP